MLIKPPGGRQISLQMVEIAFELEQINILRLRCQRLLEFGGSLIILPLDKTEQRQLFEENGLVDGRLGIGQAELNGLLVSTLT